MVQPSNRIGTVGYIAQHTKNAKRHLTVISMVKFSFHATATGSDKAIRIIFAVLFNGIFLCL